MRKICILAVLICVAAAGFAQCGGDAATTAKKADATSRLYFVFLNRPANAPSYSNEKLQEIQDGHMANIRRLGADGKLKMAGPFMDDTTVRGIFVFKASSKQEVEELLETDPAVKAGRLKGDVHPWQIDRGEIQEGSKLPQKVTMEPFVMLIYSPGEKFASMPEKQQDAIWLEHRKYHDALYASKQIEIGGPFTDHDTADHTGLTIAHGKKEDGEKLAAADPAVKAGLVKVDVHEWITAKGVLTH